MTSKTNKRNLPKLVLALVVLGFVPYSCTTTGRYRATAEMTCVEGPNLHFIDAEMSVKSVFLSWNRWDTRVLVEERRP